MNFSDNIKKKKIYFILLYKLGNSFIRFVSLHVDYETIWYAHTKRNISKLFKHFIPLEVLSDRYGYFIVLFMWRTQRGVM